MNFSISNALLKTVIGLSMSFAAPVMTFAEEGPPARPDGALFRSITNNAFEANEITITGWAEGTILSNFESGGIGPQGFFNTDEPFNFNALGLMFCKGVGCIPAQIYKPKQNVLSRIGPLPGPRGDFQWGFNVTGMIGEDVQFLKTKGLDDFDSDATKDTKLGLTQWYLDFYLPVADGMSLMLGSFQTSLANDIGYPYTPPNWFVTHTHAFAHGPAKHVGALTQIKVPTSKEFGLLSFEGGVVLGWNNLKHDSSVNGIPENDDLAYILGLRYRTPDMKTWLDIETIFGNGANDFTNFDSAVNPLGGGSPYFALSTTGEKLDRFVGFLTLTHQYSANLALALEATYGYQEGGNAGFITKDSEWYGVNIAARYKIRNNLHASVRAEWFKDEEGAHALWIVDPDTGNPDPANRAKGDVYSLTAGLSWQPMSMLTIRPELRYDSFSGDGKFFAEGRDDQFLGSMNAVIKF